MTLFRRGHALACLGTLLVCAVVALLLGQRALGQSPAIPVENCPSVGIAPQVRGFQPGGLILTSFDRTAIWVYDIDSGRRYPLPETRPCSGNCRLSPDARSITYFNEATNAINRMRLNGTERSLVSAYASDAQWWSADQFLIWTPGHQAYLLNPASGEREPLASDGIQSVSAGARWGLRTFPMGDFFARALVDVSYSAEIPVSERPAIQLGEDRTYFNASSWSPDGSQFAFVSRVMDAGGDLAGSELYMLMPGRSSIQQVTELADSYGRARINGLSAGELSWSPDGTKIAFWVVPMGSDDPTTDLGLATIHVADLVSGAVTAYCGFSTSEHTPNPPRLRWSPDGTHLAFAGNVEGDERGYLLVALDLASGRYAELSEGIYPALGSPEVVAWGLPPG
ncbi:MAG: PD40 domain-containing protein [Pleurocapsa minor GSE-CHR-MK-17-07R]|nr:PD40 domain-containing protein [Pleurocapsa minor GSE-CHR-MK 17-07R]